MLVGAPLQSASKVEAIVKRVLMLSAVAPLLNFCVSWEESGTPVAGALIPFGGHLRGDLRTNI